MANEPTEDEELLSILDPEGAIRILRSMREDIRLLADTATAFTLSPRDRQIEHLKTTVDALGGQVYALSIMLSVALKDPMITAEVNVDLDQT